MLAVHLTGTFLVCKTTLPHLRAAGGGSIVNFASVTALVARANLAAYSAAKGGIISFSRQLALDAGADNVRVNVVAPGSVRTPMTQPVYQADGAAALDSGAHGRAGGDRDHRVLPPVRRRELLHRRAPRSRRRRNRAVNDYPHLFAPGEIGGLAIRNRIVQSPMGTGLVENGRVTGARRRLPGGARRAPASD